MLEIKQSNLIPDYSQKNIPSYREQLILHHVPLVKYIALKYEYFDEDCFIEGIIGLIKAIDKYDASLGYKFSTYAVPYILGYMKNYNSKQMNLISLSEEGDVGETLQDLIEDDVDIESSYIEQDLFSYRKKFVNTILDTLSDREKMIYKLYLNGTKPYHISQLIKVTPQTISNSIKKIEKILKTNILQLEENYDKI